MAHKKKKKRGLVEFLKLISPGTTLRAALDNIIFGRTGGLLVLGSGKEVESIMDGGFKIDAEVTSSNVYELSKMDGAIILSSDATRVLCANVQLNPAPEIESGETGIRHRIAEKVARQTKCPVITISQRRNVITLFLDETKYVLHDLSILLGKVNQALQALERHKSVLDQALVNLCALEFENLVTLEEVSVALQRCEVVLRIAEIVERYIVELGDEGSLIDMQLDEVLGNLVEEQQLLVRDYVYEQNKSVEDVLEKLGKSSDDKLLDLHCIAGLLGYDQRTYDIETPVSARGYRLLSKIPRLPEAIIENIVNHMGSLAEIMASTADKLDVIDGIGEIRSRNILRGLKRIQEQVLIEHHV